MSLNSALEIMYKVQRGQKVVFLEDLPGEHSPDSYLEGVCLNFPPLLSSGKRAMNK